MREGGREDKKKKKEGRMKANEGRKLSPGNTYTARLRSVLCACALGRFLQFLVLPGVHLLNTWNGGSECTAIRRDECSRALRSRQKAACYSPLKPFLLATPILCRFFPPFFCFFSFFFSSYRGLVFCVKKPFRCVQEDKCHKSIVKLIRIVRTCSKHITPQPPSSWWVKGLASLGVSAILVTITSLQGGRFALLRLLEARRG